MVSYKHDFKLIFQVSHLILYKAMVYDAIFPLLRFLSIGVTTGVRYTGPCSFVILHVLWEAAPASPGFGRY